MVNGTSLHLPQCMLGYTHPPVREQNDRQVYKRYLAATSFAGGNESPF